MLFRVKTQRYRGAIEFLQFHRVAVGTVFHSSSTVLSTPMQNGSKCLLVTSTKHPFSQHVPMQCLERIPNTKANLRKFAKGLL